MAVKNAFTLCGAVCCLFEEGITTVAFAVPLWATVNLAMSCAVPGLGDDNEPRNLNLSGFASANAVRDLWHTEDFFRHLAEEIIIGLFVPDLHHELLATCMATQVPINVNRYIQSKIR